MNELTLRQLRKASCLLLLSYVFGCLVVQSCVILPRFRLEIMGDNATVIFSRPHRHYLVSRSLDCTVRVSPDGIFWTSARAASRETS